MPALSRRRYMILIRNSLLLLIGFCCVGYAMLLLVKSKLSEKLIAQLQQKTGLVVHIRYATWSFLDDFPHISLTVHQLIAQKPAAVDTLFYAQKVAFHASLKQLIQPPFTIQSITITNGFIVMKVDSGELYPFQIPKKQSENHSDPHQKSRMGIDFAVHKIVLKNMAFHYSNLNTQQIHAGTFHQLYLYPTFQEKIAAAQAEGKAHIQQIAFNKIKPTEFLVEQEVRFKGGFHWEKTAQNFVLDTLTLFQKNATFGIKGNFQVAEKYVDFFIQTPQIELQHATEILPQRTAKYLRSYRTQGGLAVQTYIRGSSTRPLVETFFQAKQIQFFLPNPKWHIDSLNLQGKLVVGTGNRDTDGVVIQEIKGSWKGQPLVASLALYNFKERYLQVQLKTTLELHDFEQGLKPIEELRGNMQIDVCVQGKYDDLRNPNNPPRLVGKAQLHQVALRLKNSRYLFQAINGHLTFKEKQIIIHHLTTVVRQSDFTISGTLYDFIPYLLDEKKPLIGHLRLYAHFVELNQLLKGKATTQQDTAAATHYELEVDANVHLTLQAHIKKLRFRHLNATQIQGYLTVKNKSLKTQIQADMCEGNVTVEAQLKPYRKQWMQLNTQSQLKRIDIRAFFRAMENFNQTLLKDENIEGKLTARLTFNTLINDSLRLDANSIKAHVAFTLQNGALKYFEPAMRLKNILLRNRNFEHIRFSTLQNQLTIQGKYIHIPRMAIASNIIDVYLQGTIKMGDSLNLSLQVPFSNLKRRDKSYIPQELDNDANIGKYIPIQLQGTFEEMTLQTKTITPRKKKKTRKD